MGKKIPFFLSLTNCDGLVHFFISFPLQGILCWWGILRLRRPSSRTRMRASKTTNTTSRRVFPIRLAVWSSSCCEPIPRNARACAKFWRMNFSPTVYFSLLLTRSSLKLANFGRECSWGGGGSSDRFLYRVFIKYVFFRISSLGSAGVVSHHGAASARGSGAKAAAGDEHGRRRQSESAVQGWTAAGRFVHSTWIHFICRYKGKKGREGEMKQRLAWNRGVSMASSVCHKNTDRLIILLIWLAIVSCQTLFPLNSFPLYLELSGSNLLNCFYIPVSWIVWI